MFDVFYGRKCPTHYILKLYMNHRVTNADNMVVTTEIDGIRWQCQTQWHTQLFKGTSLNWSALFNEPSVALVKTDLKRKVYRFVSDDQTFYINEYFIGSIKERLKKIFRFMPPKAEFQNLIIAQQQGISVSSPVAWGKNESGSRGYLICLGVAASISLHDMISDPDCDVALLEIALAETAKLVAKAHCEGVLHRDLHSDNILFTPENSKTTLIDLRGASINHRSGHASAGRMMRCCLNNIAMLIYDISHQLSETQLTQFVDTYIASLNLIALNGFSRKNYLIKLNKAVQRRKHKHWASLARCNAVFVKHFHLKGPWRCSAAIKTSQPDANYSASNHCFTVEDFKKTFSEPTTLLDGGVVLKNGHMSRVVAKSIVIGNVPLDVVIKRINLRKGLKGFLGMFRISKAKREWLRAANLHRRRIHTAWPVCVLERRIGFILKESILVTEKLSDGYTVDEVFKNGLLSNGTFDRRQFFMALGTLLGCLRHNRMLNRDSKTSNIMVRHIDGNIRFEFIDLDGVHPMVLDKSYYQHFALKRLLVSLTSFKKDISITDMGRLFKAYLIAAVEDSSEDKTARKAFIIKMRDEKDKMKI